MAVILLAGALVTPTHLHLVIVTFQTCGKSNKELIALSQFANRGLKVFFCFLSFLKINHDPLESQRKNMQDLSSVKANSFPHCVYLRARPIVS